MSKPDLAWLDATALSELVSRGEASPLELVDAAIERVEKLNPRLNAVITPLYEKARAEARSPSLPAGPFRGVPFLLKDLICASAGDPIHNGMKLLKERRFIAPDDTYLAARFRSAGLINIGKTNTPEFGLMPTTEPDAYGPTRNPWDTSRSSGGSSGGSAAAVAAGMVPVAHANDGGGSIRIPASACGLVGLKPSRGRVSLGPAVGESWAGAAIEGVVSRTVRDSARMLDAIGGYEEGDPYTAPTPAQPFGESFARPPRALRIGFMDRTPKGRGPLHPDCVTAVRDAAKLLESLGHEVELRHPDALDDPTFSDHFMTIIGAHTAQTLAVMAGMIGRPLVAKDVELWTWNAAEVGRRKSAIDYIDATEWINAYSRGVARFWRDDGFDLLLTPTLGAPPPPLGELLPDPAKPDDMFRKLLDFIPFTPTQNVTGQPAISLPLHWSASGLPIGVQLVGAYGAEDLLLRLAAQLEIARPWAERRPPVSA
jgi:amidase